MKKIISIILSITMLISSTSGVYAQTVDNDINKNYKIDNKQVSNVIVTDDGVEINGKFYTKEEFKNILEDAIEINVNENQNNRSATIAAGVYFIPGIGEVAIAVTGAIIVAGVAIEVGSWLYDTITDWLSDRHERKIAKIKAEIPERLRDENGDVDLGKFDKKVSGNTVKYKEKKGWTIEKDTAGHGGRKWKLKNKKGERKASLGENGEVLGD